MFLIRKGLKGISWEEKKLLSAKIIDNDFFTIFNLLMIIENSKRIFLLNNKEVQELSYSNISQRKKIKQGISAKIFGDKIGYRLFDSKKRKDHFAGNMVIDDKKHGIYFTIDEKEVFRFLMCASLEDFGDKIAEITFKNKNGKFICNAHIAKGNDSKGTYRARKFYIKNVYSLNNYNLVNHLYNIAYPEFQRLIDDESEYGLYRKSINYFKEKGMDQTVKALQDIHIKDEI